MSLLERLFSPGRQPPQGWIVEIQDPRGTKFYAAHTENHVDAEKLVRRLCNVAVEQDVRALRPAPKSYLKRLSVGPGEIKGPMSPEG